MIVGVSVVRDEADIVAQSISHMLAQVDHVIVADNDSDDGTFEILARLQRENPGRVTIKCDHEPHYQSRKITTMAMESGAEWVVPFDADEFWLNVAALRDLPDDVLIAEAQLFDHVANPVDKGWRRREPSPLPKVAVRPRPGLTIHEGNHGATYTGVHRPARTTGLEIRHFPYRSPEQMIRKARNGAAALAATDLPESVGIHWRHYGHLTDEQIRETFFTHFHSSDPESDPMLILDPVPCPSP